MPRMRGFSGLSGVPVQMRNAEAYGYFKVDFDIVWRTVCNDLPDLYKAVKAATD